MKERIDIFLEQFREQLPEYLSEISRHAKANNVPIIGRQTGDLLRYILRTRLPEKVLEIGTAVGFSALFMKECVPSAQIITVEKIEARYTQAENYFKKYDKDDRIRLIREDAADAIDELKSAGERFQVIFLDAAKGQYVSFLPNLVEMLDFGGVLVADNVFHGGTVKNSRYAVTQRDRTIHERLRGYLRAINEHEQLESMILPVDDGVAVSKKIKQ
ncbi:MAG: O-methyltransferase [Eubacterium sp.]|nr:O-methyltransferase [Eubacterium sp.]